jgi:hypothetical protein
MKPGRIQDLNRRTTGAERDAFAAAVYSTPAGTTAIGTLRWGDAVNIVERQNRRTRVCTQGGIDGWVANGSVVELRWIGRRANRYTVPLYREATGTAKHIDLLWGDPVLVMTPGASRSRVWARNWTGYVDIRDLSTTPCWSSISSMLARATACSSRRPTAAMC